MWAGLRGGWSQEGRGDTTAIRTLWGEMAGPAHSPPVVDLHGEWSQDQPLWMQDLTGQHTSDRPAQSPGILCCSPSWPQQHWAGGPLPTPYSLPLHLTFGTIVFWLVTLEAVYWGLGSQPSLLCALCGSACLSSAVFLISPGDAIATAG